MKSNFPSPIFKKVPHFTSLFLSNARYYCENKNCLEITRKFSFVKREIHSLQNEHTLQINLCASVWKWKATYFATPVSVSVGVCLLSPPIKSSDSERGSLERGRRHINILSASTFGVFFFSWGALLLRHKKGGIKRSDAKHERSLLQARRMFKQIPAATSEHGLWELLITWKSSTSMQKRAALNVCDRCVWMFLFAVTLTGWDGLKSPQKNSSQPLFLSLSLAPSSVALQLSEVSGSWRATADLPRDRPWWDRKQCCTLAKKPSGGEEEDRGAQESCKMSMRCGGAL